jgi:hypothetical protein
MPEITLSFDTSGPMFDARARAAVDRFREDATHAVGQAALSEVQMLLDRSIRNPTPYYETQILLERTVDAEVVHDRGIVYGPWLEGTGSRNRTTRFKGYASFRRAAQAVQARVPRIVAPHLDRLVRRLGG